MLGNVTSQISDSINWLGNLSLILQLIASFLIAFFTISYTQHLRDKRDFETGMEWFLSEITIIQTILKMEIKPSVENQIKIIEANPEKRNYAFFSFPDFRLNAFDFILSHGFFKLLGEKNMLPIITIQQRVRAIRHFSKSYYSLLNIPVSESPPNQDVNENSLKVLKGIIKEIDAIDEILNNFQIPKYPHTYLPSFTKFFKKTLPRQEKK